MRGWAIVLVRSNGIIFNLSSLRALKVGLWAFRLRNTCGPDFSLNVTFAGENALRMLVLLVLLCTQVRTIH